MTITELRDNLKLGRNLTITAGDSTTTAYPSIMDGYYIIDEHLIPVSVIAEMEESGAWSVGYE